MKIRINQVKIPISLDEENFIISKLAKLLRVSPGDIKGYTILRKSIDARKKDDLCLVYTFAVDLNVPAKKIKALLSRTDIGKYQPVVYKIPEVSDKSLRPIVIGMGPAGLFAAYSMCLAGLKPILLERGRSVRDRKADIEKYWETGLLKPDSNVQFGEGGAGTFSDGKLNTQINDTNGRNAFVLNTFVKYGAPDSILYESKPHIGTDILISVIENMRLDMIKMGADIRFESQATNFNLSYESANPDIPYIRSVRVNNAYDIDTGKNPVVLAIGHSSRDTFYTLHQLKIPMQAKEFAVGFRVEHLQHDINLAQYHTDDLGPAPYKLTAKSFSGRGVYSFCMCPGGYVVDSSSEPSGICVNGMSYSDRGSANANSAVVVTVGKNEFDMDDPLSGIAYQRSLERKAYELGHGLIPQQLYGDFVANTESTEYGKIVSCHKGRAAFANLRGIYSDEINQSFMEGMQEFGRRIPGFDENSVVLSGVESRTSSPVRITRDESCRSVVVNLYPCGEGAGYAGGITSAAMDGLKVAEAIAVNERGKNV